MVATMRVVTMKEIMKTHDELESEYDIELRNAEDDLDRAIALGKKVALFNMTIRLYTTMLEEGGD